MIANSLTKSVVSCDIRTIAITNHTAVELCLKVELETGGGPRWRMNTSLLQDKPFKISLGEDLKSFFEINIGSTREIKNCLVSIQSLYKGEVDSICFSKEKRKPSQNQRFGEGN